MSVISAGTFEKDADGVYKNKGYWDRRMPYGSFDANKQFECEIKRCHNI